MISAQINNTLLERFKKRLKDARSALKNDGVAMRQVAVFLDQWVQGNFKTQGGNVGGWAPFAQGGRVRRGRFDANAKLLQDTGALRHSFLPFVKKGVAGIGSDLPYSADHEYGRPTRGLPQRRMLMKDKEVRADIKEIMDNWLSVSIRKAQ